MIFIIFNTIDLVVFIWRWARPVKWAGSPKWDPSLRNSYKNIMYSYEKWASPPSWDENFQYEQVQTGLPSKVGYSFLSFACTIFAFEFFPNSISTWLQWILLWPQLKKVIVFINGPTNPLILINFWYSSCTYFSNSVNIQGKFLEVAKYIILYHKIKLLYPSWSPIGNKKIPF